MFNWEPSLCGSNKQENKDENRSEPTVTMIIYQRGACRVDIFKSREGRYVVRIVPLKLLLNWGGVMRERVMWSRGKSSEMSWKSLVFCHRTETSLSVIITDSRHCPYCVDKKCSMTLGLSEIIENVSLNVTNEKAKIGQLTTSSTMFWRTAQISVAVEDFCRTLGLCDR